MPIDLHHGCGREGKSEEKVKGTKIKRGTPGASGGRSSTLLHAPSTPTPKKWRGKGEREGKVFFDTSERLPISRQSELSQVVQKSIKKSRADRERDDVTAAADKSLKGGQQARRKTSREETEKGRESGVLPIEIGGGLEAQPDESGGRERRYKVSGLSKRNHRESK